MSDVRVRKIEFKNGRGLTLRGLVHEPRKYDTAIIFLHGFPGSIESNLSKRMGKTFGKLGYLVLRFEFSGTNKSDGNFEEKTMSKEVEDVKYAVDFLKKNFNFKKLILIGSSTGAIDAALYAHKDRRIDKLVLMGCDGNLKHAAHYDFTDEQVRDFWTKGFIVYKNKKGKKWWAHNKRLKKAFYDEFFTLDLPGSIHNFRKPILIVHGRKDMDVPFEENVPELMAAANKPKRLAIIKNAGHSYSTPNQWKEVVLNINKFVKHR
jgi:uncharacterized protein